MNAKDKQKAIEAVDLLNDFVGDLKIAVSAYNHYKNISIPINRTTYDWIFSRRMYLSYIVITLFKIIEVYDRYKAVVPDKSTEIFKKLFKEINSRKVREFRNKCIGHIWDKGKNKPLTRKELEPYLIQIHKGDEDSFIKWISDPPNTSLNTVVGIVGYIRNSMITTYQLSHHEIFSPDT